MLSSRQYARSLSPTGFLSSGVGQLVRLRKKEIKQFFLIFASAFLGRALSGFWFILVLFISMIFQSSVRSSLMTITYQPEVNSLEDGITLLDTIYAPHIKVSDERPVEEYLEESAIMFGRKVLNNVSTEHDTMNGSLTVLALYFSL